MTLRTNISLVLSRIAGESPGRRAVVQYAGRDRQGRPTWAQLTFGQLDHASTVVAAGLKDFGIGPGTKTLCMVPPGIDFMIVVFALFKAGAVVVMIDPGMGLRRVGKCLEQVAPEAFVGTARAHVARMLFGWGGKRMERLVTAGKRWLWGGVTLDELLASDASSFETELLDPDECSAILFTSGSTGPAKGACYSHGIFEAQVKSLREVFQFGPGAVDLATFPLFAIFDIGLGNTAVIPDMDASRPITADPSRLFEAAHTQGCTQMFASPMLLDKLARYGHDTGSSLPLLERVISAGAPVRPEVLKSFSDLLGPGAVVHTPYGATEALPVSSITGAEILSETAAMTRQGLGICVGRPDPSIDVKVIRISDDAFPAWSDDLVVPDGDVGEIAVRGPVVTRSYYNRPDATRSAKIACTDGTVYHRMGDLGRIDEKGRLWFYGRKAHRVTTAQGELFTIPCEAVFDALRRVRRSALVGVGKRGEQVPVICIEPEEGVPMSAQIREELVAELKSTAARHDHTQPIRHFLFHPSFPVDPRHNAKIRREELSDWATDELGRRAG